MKANEAPEKIYFGTQQQNVNPFFGLTHKCADTDIEYTRTDAFIEKAVKWLKREILITDLSPSNMLDIKFKVFDKEGKKAFIEKFKKYMKRK